MKRTLPEATKKLWEQIEERIKRLNKLSIVLKPAQSFQRVNGGLRQHGVTLVPDEETFEQAARKLAPPFIAALGQRWSSSTELPCSTTRQSWRNISRRPGRHLPNRRLTT